MRSRRRSWVCGRVRPSRSITRTLQSNSAARSRAARVDSPMRRRGSSRCVAGASAGHHAAGRPDPPEGLPVASRPCTRLRSPSGALSVTRRSPIRTRPAHREVLAHAGAGAIAKRQLPPIYRAQLPRHATVRRGGTGVVLAAGAQYTGRGDQDQDRDARLPTRVRPTGRWGGEAMHAKPATRGEWGFPAPRPSADSRGNGRAGTAGGLTAATAPRRCPS